MKRTGIALLIIFAVFSLFAITEASLDILGICVIIKYSDFPKIMFVVSVWMSLVAIIGYLLVGWAD